MSNFTFIKVDFPQLYADAHEAERLTYDSPTATAMFCRSTLENAVNWLYENDRKFTRPWRTDLNSLMQEPCFTELFNQRLLNELHLIRKIGNNAAHGTRINEDEAVDSLKYLFRLLRHLAIYYGKKTPDTQVFDEALIPRPNAAQTTKPVSHKDDAKQIKKLQDNIDYKNRMAREAEKKITEQAQQNAALKRQLEQHQAELTTLRQQREQSIDIEAAVPPETPEARTRRRYIDVSLKLDSRKFFAPWWPEIPR